MRQAWVVNFVAFVFCCFCRDVAVCIVAVDDCEHFQSPLSEGGFYCYPPLKNCAVLSTRKLCASILGEALGLPKQNLRNGRAGKEQELLVGALPLAPSVRVANG